MFIQMYVIVLNDGTEIEVAENYHLPMEQSLFAVYEKAKPTKAVKAMNRMGETVCVLKENIRYIKMTHVERI